MMQVLKVSHLIMRVVLIRRVELRGCGYVRRDYEGGVRRWGV
jgi:hypothetical protein